MPKGCRCVYCGHCRSFHRLGGCKYPGCKCETFI